MLAMRRTLWGVPRELVPVVFAAATRAVAATQRKRLEGFVRDSGVSTRPGAWITRAGKAALAAVEARGEAMTSEVVADVPLLAKKLRFGSGQVGGRAERGRPRAAAARDGGAADPRPPARQLDQPTVPLGHDRGTGSAGRSRSWTSPRRRRSSCAAGSRAFGPATETDMRWWTGWTARETRAALAAIPHAEVDLDGATGYVLADDLEPTPPPEPSAALLPTLDPTTMGWKERDWYLGPHGPTLFDSNGNAGPTIWWDGRIVGGWSQRRDGEIALGLLEDVGRDAREAIDAEAERFRAWVGDIRFSPGFLPPFQRALGES